jgi:phosphopentomutase
MPPTGETLLDRLTAAAVPVLAIGKIADLFARRGITRAVPTPSDDAGMDAVGSALRDEEAGLVFANLVDFDTQYGHRNDVAGYARNLEQFDNRLSLLLPRLRQTDLLVITADHGNDPTTPSTDHSREYVPLLVVGPGVTGGVNLGTRSTFADLGQTLAENFRVLPLASGQSFLQALCR